MADAISGVEAYNLEHFGTRGGGFDLSNLNETSNEEIEAHLHQYLEHVRDRGQFYGLNALSFLTGGDNRPDIAKLANVGTGRDTGGPRSATRRGRSSRTSSGDDRVHTSRLGERDLQRVP